MVFDIVLRSGLYGSSTKVGVISIGKANVDVTASFAGSLHILEMGDHFDDYLVTGHFPALMSGPVTAPKPFGRLIWKHPSMDVMGNFGEAIFASVYTRHYGAANSEIVHIHQPVGSGFRFRCPDFLVAPVSIFAQDVSNFGSTIPTTLDFIPAECKATLSNSNERAYTKNAAEQLAAFWKQSLGMNPSYPVGYGIASVMSRHPSPTVTLTYFWPKANMATKLQAALSKKKLRIRKVLGCLHDSAI